ncbi:sec-independent protein translocase protein TATA, chloroplastic-like [Salvia miltiorrhiza]|uniref:sec-independent protein translocase protein TATA, chloroplastic-like n=1 Tax=Salvia miltiorrhiza TaxID=226208 RepID=UPI0025AC48CE|nr:sec-independent protein translocase protein TATA, chloroplastic-like [Salvia miltiorrhiza]
MATFASAAITPSLALNPPRRFTSLSSSSSVFFSSNVCNRARLGLAVDRPRAAKRRGMSCNCVFGLGVPELVVIVGVATLLFGPKKLPEVGKSIGKTLKSFQQAAKEFETELKKDIDEPSAEASNEKKITTVSEEEKQEDKVPTANGSS